MATPLPKKSLQMFVTQLHVFLAKLSNNSYILDVNRLLQTVNPGVLGDSVYN